MAEETAVMNKKMDMTRERMFLGAFVKAYSRPVMDAKTSLIAMRMYLEGRLREMLDKKNFTSSLTIRIESKR